MNPRLLLPALLGAALFLGASGCGDEDGGGCGPAPQKKEEPAAAGAAGGGPSGGGGPAAELITQDKRGRVPKPYQRPGTRDEDGEKSDRSISKPQIAKSTEAAAPAASRVEVLDRKVGGVADRVKLACAVKAVSKDGKCMTAKNYLEIKERCCPGGLVESCTTTADGVLIVGRGCEPAP